MHQSELSDQQQQAITQEASLPLDSATSTSTGARKKLRRLVRAATASLMQLEATQQSQDVLPQARKELRRKGRMLALQASWLDALSENSDESLRSRSADEHEEAWLSPGIETTAVQNTDKVD